MYEEKADVLLSANKNLRIWLLRFTCMQEWHHTWTMHFWGSYNYRKNSRLNTKVSLYMYKCTHKYMYCTCHQDNLRLHKRCSDMQDLSMTSTTFISSSANTLWGKWLKNENAERTIPKTWPYAEQTHLKIFECIIKPIKATYHYQEIKLHASGFWFSRKLQENRLTIVLVLKMILKYWL